MLCCGIMICFNTKDIALQDRFDHWREVRGKNLFGVTIELPAERRQSFEGWFSARAVGHAVASHIQASAYQVSRTPSDIARMASESLCIGLQVHGPGTLDTGRGHTHLIGNGDMVIYHSDQPYRAMPVTTDNFRFQVLKIPIDEALMLGQPVHDFFATRLTATKQFERPFYALFRALMAGGEISSDPQVDLGHITRLALVSRARLKPGVPEVRGAIRAGLRYAAREVLVRRKHQPHLTPNNVADELGISERQLFILFEDTEQSYLQTLTSLRLNEARRLLSNELTLPVTQVGFNCGFDSVATFYRLFKRIYGMAPGEFRERHILSL